MELASVFLFAKCFVAPVTLAFASGILPVNCPGIFNMTIAPVPGK